jgi:3-oxoacyl-[acyl-carrier protein] reductase
MEYSMNESSGGTVNGELSGRVAIVTGASRRGGIGAAICRARAARGAEVLFTHWRAYDRDAGESGEDPEGPEILLDELRGLGVRAEELEADLSLPETPGLVLDAAERRLGPPSILVNNAAYSTQDGFERLDAGTLDAHYAVNVRATALLSVGFARGYEAGEKGRIVNLTSGQDNGPMPGELAYVASKGAISAFTRTLAAEVGGKGITVNAVNPGPTDTGWMTEEIKHELLPRFPLGRIGLPEDAARLVAWLASDEAGWVTGQVIDSEGGFFR